MIKLKKEHKVKQPIFQEITIIGAGPAGATAALHLNKLGISCMILDRATFPRPKICGDALSGKVSTVLNRIDPEILKRFHGKKLDNKIFGIRVVAPNGVKMDIPFKWDYDAGTDIAPGGVVRRYELDNFLTEELTRSKLVNFQQGVGISNIERISQGFILSDETGAFSVKTKMLLIANGANSKFTRQLTGIKKENKHFAGAVRGYYMNVSGFHPDGFIELHFLKEYLPGYFWIFPMQGNRANVGLGIRTDYISRKKVNLRKALQEIVRDYPGVGERFRDSYLEGKIEGHPLPLGSKKHKRSGNRFMLLGDAGHLVDPLTGEGVGNAVYSGWIAAEQVAKCFDTGRFDEKEMLNYDKRIQRVMGVELKLSSQLQRLVRYKSLVNVFAKRYVRHPKLQMIVTSMFMDLELRKKLVRPGFLLRILFNK